MKIYLCKPYFKHFFNMKFIDIKHTIHKLSCGIILIDHIEPDGYLASKQHKNYIVMRLI